MHTGWRKKVRDSCFCLVLLTFLSAPAPNPLASASNGYDYKNVSTCLITVQFLKEESKTKKIKQTMVKKYREKQSVPVFH